MKLLKIISVLSFIKEAQPQLKKAEVPDIYNNYCAPGWFLQGDKCVLREEIPFICDGKHYSKIGNNCVKQHYKAVVPICEPGYHPKVNRRVERNEKRNHKLCTSKDRVDYSITCPEGYNLDHTGKKCHMERVVDPVYQDCGVKKTNPAYKGARLGDGQLACPLGSTYNKKNDNCVLYKTLRSQKTCPHPYVHFGQLGTGWRCQIRDRMPLGYTCEKGYELVNDGTKACIKHHIDNSKRYCPDGWNLTGVEVRPDGQKSEEVHDPFREDTCVRYIFDDAFTSLPKNTMCQTVNAKGFIDNSWNDYDPALEQLETLFDDVL